MRPLLTRAVPVALVVAATMAIVSAADAAPRWASPTVVGPSSRDAGAPAVAVTPDGEAIATWSGGHPERVQVSSRRPGRGWSPPVTIAPVREEVQGPQIAVSAGKAVIVWTDNVRTGSGEDRVVLTSTRLRGKRWSRPRNISAEKRWREEPRGEEPQIAMTRRGKAIVVWSATNEKHLTVSFVASATQPAAGTKWTAPVGIRGSYEAEAPQVAVTPTDETVTIWGASYNEESHMGVSSRPPKGPWKSATLLSNPGPFPQPLLAVTSRGEAIGAWVKEPEGGLEANVQVATHTPGGKWRLKTLEPQGYGTSPKIVTEPGGRATVLWSRYLATEEQAIAASNHPPGGPWSEPTSVAAEGLQIPYLSESPIEVTPQGESIALWLSDPSTGERMTIQSASRPPGQPWSEPTQVAAFPPGARYGASDLQLALAPKRQSVRPLEELQGRTVGDRGREPCGGGGRVLSCWSSAPLTESQGHPLTLDSTNRIGGLAGDHKLHLE
ncbi:MAG TPA: hypothetical protein VEP91_09120 [Solirubrobacterales bacterium]|nr:hypothetical protein [Solirubrobacterales bacterium]